MRATGPYVSARALPRWSGRCDAVVTKRAFDGAMEQRGCLRQAVYPAPEGGKFCIQHHPDEAAAVREDHRLEEKAQRAFDLHDELVAALRDTVDIFGAGKLEYNAPALFRRIKRALARAEGK